MRTFSLKLRSYKQFSSVKSKLTKQKVQGIPAKLRAAKPVKTRTSIRRGPGKHWKNRPAVKACRDGREICNLAVPEGRFEYYMRIAQMCVRQYDDTVGYIRCCNCGEPLKMCEATFEHEDGRGMGGARRDDRIAIFDDEGRFVRHQNGASHLECNSKRGSRRTEIWHGNNVWFELKEAA